MSSGSHSYEDRIKYQYDERRVDVTLVLYVWDTDEGTYFGKDEGV